MRRGKKVGGALPKLRKLVDANDDERVDKAFGVLRERLAEAV
jgi:hypothetical protein